MIRIGTRGSKLAMVQAKKVKKALSAIGVVSDLVEIYSQGDIDKTTPLNSFGNPGIFTKELDSALFKNKIDIAVHSCKDLPSQLDNNITIEAVLERDDHRDILVTRENFEFLDKKDYRAKIATGSLRRKSQWLSKYPQHEIIPIRGNIDTRLKKLKKSEWDGLIISNAAIQRLKATTDKMLVLDEFIPAPCQGIIAITVRKDKLGLIGIVQNISHQETFKMMQVERDFLNHLQVGCSFPVGGISTIDGENISFKAEILSLDGTEKVQVEKTVELNDYLSLGKKCAEELISKGQHLLQEIKHD
jgi:hydroxymethylbilane synthase